VESTPSKLYADSIPPVRRSSANEIFFLRIIARPLPGSDEFGHEGGAYVNCYIDADDLRSAELRAIDLIRQHGWAPERFDTWQLTCSDCADDTSSENDAPSPRSLVGQARVEGECCVFHTWPIDAPDAEEET
jgi:hypothetical protein